MTASFADASIDNLYIQLAKLSIVSLHVLIIVVQIGPEGRGSYSQRGLGHSQINKSILLKILKTGLGSVF